MILEAVVAALVGGMLAGGGYVLGYRNGRRDARLRLVRPLRRRA